MNSLTRKIGLYMFVIYGLTCLVSLFTRIFTGKPLSTELQVIVQGRLGGAEGNLVPGDLGRGEDPACGIHLRRPIRLPDIG